MGFFRNKSGGAVDRRRITERRTREQKLPYNHRIRPDRRLNNISVEWIPVSEIDIHPALREALNSNKKKPTGTPAKKPSAS